MNKTCSFFLTTLLIQKQIQNKLTSCYREKRGTTSQKVFRDEKRGGNFIFKFWVGEKKGGGNQILPNSKGGEPTHPHTMRILDKTIGMLHTEFGQNPMKTH